jgi:hypothetical protein
MHTLRRSSRDQLWTVGFESVNDGKWVAIDDFPDKQQAIELVSFLNGGEMPRWWRQPV